ncbi:MAG TPA: FAD-binding protein, partial [Treponemataceae bacterium]|nr:FAD-binding protein [Treponemataceae bacterium]
GVYSFCMCPGGLIVPSATEDSGIVINGMSPSSRNTRWSNAAIVVETRPEDVPAEFRKLRDGQDDALAGLRFRTWVEEEAKKQGDGQKAPAQRLEDFLAGKDSTTLPECSYSPGIVASRLDRWLPEQIRDRLAEAFVDFDKNMKGFVCKEAVLVAPETRTSSPVRILRDPKTLESPAIAGLYPAGEGAGYAGGIVSSAMDGERCADAIVATFAARRE